MDSTQIAGALTRDKRTVKKWLKRFEETGSVETKKKLGRNKITTEEEYLVINLSVIGNPKATLRQIKLQNYQQ